MLTKYGKIAYRAIFGGGVDVRANFNNGSSIGFVDINGNTSHSLDINTFVVPSLTQSTSYDSNNQSFASGGKVIFGTNASISENLTTLENKTQMFQRSNPNFHPSESDNGNITRQSFTVANTTEQDITYTCFGIVSYNYSSYSGEQYARPLLMSVFMLDAPVTIPAGESRSIEIKFDYSNL